MRNKDDIQKPAKLKKGDCVGIVAPAGVVDSEPLRQGVDVIRRMGFEPLLGKHVLSRHRYLAGTDEERSADIMAMFADPQVKAIFCARGGYGADRVIAHLKPGVIRRNPKIFVGSSDITLLLIYLYQKCSLVTFHGPMVAGSFGRQPMAQTQKQFKGLLTGDPSARTLSDPGIRVLRPGSAKGKVIGGCLTLLCRSLKTSYEIDTRDKIMLIEDVNEPLYRIDGMLWQLKRAGKFKDVKGVVFGEMINCRSDQHGGSLEEIAEEVFAGETFPVFLNAPVGHGSEIWTVPFGVEAKLDTKTKLLQLTGSGLK